MRSNFSVAPSSNRLNSSADFAGQSWKGKSTFALPSTVIPANSTIPFPLAGNRFYLAATTAAVEIRPEGGSFISYAVGQGLEVPPENAWGKLEVKNTSGVAITITLVVGFDEFIDNTVILNAASVAAIAAAIVNTPSVTYGPVENSANNIAGALGNFRHFSFTLTAGQVTFNGGALIFNTIGTYFQWQGFGSVFPSPAFDASAGTVAVIGVR